MIRAMVSGTLHGDPQTRTSRGGQPFTTARMKADASDGTAVWCSLIAFGDVGERLATLKSGAAISVSGRAKLSAWLSKDGQPSAGLSVAIDELATLRGRPKPPRPSESLLAETGDPARTAQTVPGSTPANRYM